MSAKILIGITIFLSIIVIILTRRTSENYKFYPLAPTKSTPPRSPPTPVGYN
jgi:hypothetical protein